MRRGSIVALLGLALIAGGVATAVAIWPTWLPVAASREAGRIHFVIWFVVGICIAIFAIVWMASHAINVLILLSPWGAIDAALKSARTARLGV